MTADEIARDPLAHGFIFTGWGVAFPDTTYLKELRILKPSAGVEATANASKMLILDRSTTAAIVAKNTGGMLAHVYDSPTERLVVWGNHA